MTTAQTVLAELAAREPIFHPPPPDRKAFDALVVEDFWEVGASGNVYDKDTIWAVVSRRGQAGEQVPLRAADHGVRRLGPDTWLLTYVLWQGERQTRRVTVWRRVPVGWVAVYHQGTEVAPLPPEVAQTRTGQAAAGP